MRYALLPYIYTEFVRAASSGTPFIRGLFLDFDEASYRLDEDEFLCGSALLVAPIVRPAVRGRLVYLPGTAWLKVKATSTGLTGEQVVTAGDSFVKAGLDEIPLYVKPGSLIPMAEPSNRTSAECPSRYRVIGFTDSIAECAILLDDGETLYTTWESYPKAICTVKKSGKKWLCDVRFENAPVRQLELDLELWNSSGLRHELRVRC
jgi:alpha-glucosidase